MEIVSNLSVTSVLWIEALRPGEGGPTRRIMEDLSVALARKNAPFEFCAVKSAADFLGTLDVVARNARQGWRPIVHFDMHGSQKDGLEIGATRESIPWSQLAEKLRAINIETRNNLCVISASCFGLHAVTPIALSQPCPFYILIAPEKEVTTGFLEDHIAAFYDDIFSSGDLSGAFQRKLSSQMKYFHCEKFLAVTLSRYIRNSCKGRGAKDRRERLLTEILGGGQNLAKEAMKAARAQIKSGVLPDQALLDRYVDSFLIGKTCGYTIDDLLELIETAGRGDVR